MSAPDFEAQFGKFVKSTEQSLQQVLARLAEHKQQHNQMVIAANQHRSQVLWAIGLMLAIQVISVIFVAALVQ